MSLSSLLVHSCGRRAWLAAFLLVGLTPAIAAAQSPTRAFVDAAFLKKDKPTFDFKDHPQLKIGRKLQIDFRLKFQKDKRTSDAPFSVADSRDVDIAKKRIAVEGDVMNAVAFQIEREMSGDDPWRDVYVDFHKFSFVGAMYGKFKEPFSVDENTGATNNDFARRSSIANLLAPGRDKGWMVHGQVLDHAVGYEFGKFDHDGRNARSVSGNRVSGGPTTAWRITTQPLRRVVKKDWNDLEFGYAQTTSDLELTADFDNKSSITGKTVLGEEIFAADQYVSGKRDRRGIEFRWRPGPFSVKFENIKLTEERLGLSVEDTDLPPYEHKGWYVSGTWALTGEEKAKGLDQPKKPINKGGVGAIEVAGRVEHITFGSAASDEPPSNSPRARVPFGNGDKITTFGVNWYPIHWVKIQIDFIHEVITDPSRGPLPSKAGFNSRIIRFQFAL
jgi:phosphate-selective porin